MKNRTKTASKTMFRVTLGCLCFVACLFFTAHYAIKNQQRPKPKEKTYEALFYQAIGHTPEDHKQMAIGDFTLQIDSLPSRVAAEKKVRFLERAGIHAFYTPMILEDRMIYKVRSGWFSSEEEATNFAKKLPAEVQGVVTRLQ